VLATALYQALPASTEPELQDLPGQGRKLLAFADSRQDAAFFAPYLERTYRQVLRRRLILKTLLDDPAGCQGRLRLQDLVGRLRHQAEAAGLFTQRQSYDECQARMARWLMQELIAWDRRINLEGLGLLQFRLVRPTGWSAPQPLLQPPWNLAPEEAWHLLALLLDTLRHQGAVTFPDNVDPRDEAFSPRNRELFMREDRADSKNGIFSWVPTKGNNRRLDILTRLLARTSSLSETERRPVATKALRNIWRHLTDSELAWRDHREPAPGGCGSPHQPSFLGSGTDHRDFQSWLPVQPLPEHLTHQPSRDLPFLPLRRHVGADRFSSAKLGAESLPQPVPRIGSHTP
jgi:hypothetical protein